LIARLFAMEIDSSTSIRQISTARPSFLPTWAMGNQSVTVCWGRPFGTTPTVLTLCGAWSRRRPAVMAVDRMVTVSGPNARSQTRRRDSLPLSFMKMRMAIQLRPYKGWRGG